ncbi:MAG: type II secretion system GspH family protein [Planctomycetales bacterium]|nr:type II secretion system GspH family protein [Planctomycetales bacterium]
MKKQKKGFTLIELLVVIAIIALLLSVIMPALRKVKEQAKAAVCQTRVRQLTMGAILYAGENDNLFFPVIDAQFQYWYYKIAPYLSAREFSDQSNASAGQSEGAMEVLRCPVTKNREQTGNSWAGSANYNWKFVGTQGSFGMNMWLTPKGSWSETGIVKADHVNFFTRLSEATGRVPVFADSAWVGSWPYSESLAPTVSELDSDTLSLDHSPPYFMKRFCIDRHGMAVNIGFVDNSTERVPLKSLWLLRWSKNFGAREVEVPRR